MNRTTIFLSSAVVLLLVAVVGGWTTKSAPPPPPVAPVPVATPQSAPQPAPQPVPVRAGSLTMTGKLSHPFVATGTSDLFATLEVVGVDQPGVRRSPVNLAVVIDRSGSMAGSKIENARRAALKLVDLLTDEDRLSVVHYGTDVRVMGGVFATAENKDRLRRYIRGIADEGGTNIGDGLAAGRAQLQAASTDFRVNRLLLLSDGQPTVGVTSAGALANLVANLRRSGITVTALGVGADFNEDLMQRLADVGGGSYGFINNAVATADLFERDLKQAGAMVARGVTLTVGLPDGVDFAEAYGRPARQSGRSVVIDLPDFSASQTEKVVLRLVAHPNVRSGAIDIGRFQLAYEDLLANGHAEAQVALSASVVEDATLAQARRDKDAVVLAAKAQAAVNYKRAAEAVDRGDFQGARQAVEDNSVLFDDAAKVAGSGALADERQVNDTMFGLSSNAAAAPAETQRTTVKQLKVQSLRSSGRGASAY